MSAPEILSASLSTFALISLAEVGDKSQLVCMTLAARHRAGPVILGAAVAFALLNALAVLFGAGVAAWVPERVVSAAVALLFGAFGVSALLKGDVAGPAEVEELPGRSVFLTAFLLIIVAEFGDKTQLAVAGLAGSLPPWAVWSGACAALLLLSVLGAWAGRTILQRLPVRWLHRLSGALFIVFACFAAWRVVSP